ncbi:MULTISPECIES: hypothetical protein [Streptomyces]|uniref:Uncharacterized protein n=1 Tax=Streptomyces flaveolus TaxID=67297 RepID=A0ABV1VSD8_9ACTN
MRMGTMGRSVVFSQTTNAAMTAVPPISEPSTRFTSSSISWSSTAFADTAAADSAAACSATFSLVIDASSMIGSYTERFTVPAHGLTIHPQTPQN